MTEPMYGRCGDCACFDQVRFAMANGQRDPRGDCSRHPVEVVTFKTHGCWDHIPKAAP